MTRTTQTLLRTACLAGLLLASVTNTAVRASADSPTSGSARRPNVLFLLADDQRQDTIGALGNEVIKTPNIDRLARDGVAFNNAYCMGSHSNAVCVPSRNMIFSANHSISKRLFGGIKGIDKLPDLPMFPLWMKKAGYATMHSGKPDNGPRVCLDAFEVSHHVKRGGNSPERNVNNVIEFLRKKEQDKDERPFFAYVGFATPHFPFHAPKEFKAMYKAEDITLPPSFQPMPTYCRGVSDNIMYPMDDRFMPLPRTKEKMRAYWAGYYADISYLDSQVGRVIKVVEELGELDNTIIIYAGDHGWSLGEHGIMSKSNVYEHSLGAPLIFSSPGIPKGKTSDALVYIHDIFPTVCELAGIEVPKKIDSKSLAGIIQGKSQKVRDSLFLWLRKSERAVRDERWKLIRYPNTNVSQLYDLQNDPYETKNLADDPAQAERVKKMMKLIEKWQKELGAEIPLSCENPENPVFDPEEHQRALDELFEQRKAFAEKT